MLAVIPDTLFGRVGAVFSALIVVFGVSGMTMHRDFYANKPRKDFFCFYTNLSNLLVLFYFALLAPRLYARSSLRALIPHAEFCLMMSIMLTFCVFHLLLFPAVRRTVFAMPRTHEFYLVLINNLIVHYLVPLMVFAYWLLCSPGKRALVPADALLWTLFPIGYFACMLLRSRSGRIIEETGTPYPYPFMDVKVFGARRVMRMCLLLYGLCLGAGLAAVAIIRLLFAVFGGSHALVLI